MATKVSALKIYFHSVVWGFCSLCCLIIMAVEFFKNTLILADGLALGALTVGFLVQSYHPKCNEPKLQTQTFPLHHQIVLGFCAVIFFVSFMVRFGWL